MPRRNLIGVTVLAGLLFASLASRSVADFAVGEFLAYGQGTWGATPTATDAAELLQDNYDTVYSSVGGLFEVGQPDPPVAGSWMKFTSANKLVADLSVSGPDSYLAARIVKPLTTAVGGFSDHTTTWLY
jgi:hypothetical protein